MEQLTPGDIVSLKSDTSISFTLGSVFKSVDGVEYAEVYWFSRLTAEIKEFEIPLSALTK